VKNCLICFNIWWKSRFSGRKKRTCF